MKRKSTLLIGLLLIACLTLAACNKTKTNRNKKTWPSVSYLTDDEEYTGAGNITHTVSFADDSNSVCINNATAESVSDYRTQLENAGWTLSIGPVNTSDNTAWGYTKNELTCSIRLYSTAKTEERSSGNYTYNLYIGFANDDTSLPPSGNALSTPTVSISNSGLASWSAIPNASSYKYKINNGTEQTAPTNREVQLTNGQSITVKAVGDGTNYTDSAYSASQTYTTDGGGNSTGISVSDFDYQLGNHYYISSCWDIKNYDPNYTYQEYRKIALIDGVYFIESYSYNYEQSGTQEDYLQSFFIPNGADYTEYYRYDANNEFESKSVISSEFDNKLIVALGETSITRAKQKCIAVAFQYITAGAVSTHDTGRTVKKYSYSGAGIPLFDFYVDSQTKACLKFNDYVNDGNINLSIFSTSGNAWGSNGLPARPDGDASEPTVLSVPVVTINNSGLASWSTINGANSYKIKINGGTEELAVGMSEQLSNGDTIQVKAIGDGDTYLDSAWSTIKTYTAQEGDTQPHTLTTPIVTINQTGLATWSDIPNASSYKYKINNGVEQTAPANREVQLTNGQSITVKAVGDGITYTDSVYSASETYTEIAVNKTWPASTKLAEYGFGGLTQPEGSTISFVGETKATADEPAKLTIMISNGTGLMFNNLTTELYNLGTTYNLDSDGVSLVASNTQNVSDLILTGTNISSFLGMKPTDTTDVYDLVLVDYYVNAGTDTNENPIAAQTFIISFKKEALTSSEQNYEDFISLPENFTISFGDNGETKTLTKDGDKLHLKVVSEYENKERLALKQGDGTYKVYEKDNQDTGTWDTDYVPEYDNIFFALEAMEYNFFSFAQRMMNNDLPESISSGTVADMMCILYNFEDEYYTYSYYCYNGLVFKTEEHNNGQTITFMITSYSTAGDLSGSNYSIN